MISGVHSVPIIGRYSEPTPPSPPVTRQSYLSNNPEIQILIPKPPQEPVLFLVPQLPVVELCPPCNVGMTLGWFDENKFPTIIFLVGPESNSYPSRVGDGWMSGYIGGVASIHSPGYRFQVVAMIEFKLRIRIHRIVQVADKESSAFVGRDHFWSAKENG